jgi:hypothetical protein
MLQEVNCRPPVQCEEQRVSGGSEIRTDLFQVAKGANRKVNLKFEFFEIPDRIELYFDGKKIFGVGPQSGQGNQTFNLPANAEYVGVKLIGNDNVNTRWWYVISCSGSEICKRRTTYTDIPMKTTVNINSSKIEIIPRSQWNARSPITNDPRRSYERYQEPLQDILDSIVIHHAGNDRHETMRDVQDLHMDKKEAADIRYHFGIDKKGRIFEGRDIQVKGAHVEGNNTGKIGIVFLADLDEGLLDRDDELTPEMEQSLLNLINYLKNKYPKIKFLGGHNEFDTRRNCPGNIVEEKMPIWRRITSLCSLNDNKCPTTIIPKGN